MITEKSYFLKNFKFFVFDLDNTLINTEAIKRGFKDFDNYIENRTLLSNSVASFDELNKVFSLDDLRVEWEKIVVPGAKAFLKEVKESGGFNTLISIGNKNWQEFKVKNCGLEEFFEDDYFVDKGVENKIRVFESMVKYNFVDLEKCVHFNDKPEEMRVFLEKYREIKGVLRLEKDDERYSLEACEELVMDFPERLMIIEDFLF